MNLEQIIDEYFDKYARDDRDDLKSRKQELIEEIEKAFIEWFEVEDFGSRFDELFKINK